jgi:arylformamidase
MKIWDVSRALSNDLAPWPGDTSFDFHLAARLGEKSTVNVGAMSMSVHNGSHADARFHFEQAGWSIDQAQLELYFGQAAVVDLSAEFVATTDSFITIAHLAGAAEQLRQTGRLLLKTGVWLDSTLFPKCIPVIAPDVADWLGDAGVRLIGLDLPSVDRIDAKHLENHHALARNGIAIVESLDLSGIDPGVYNLVALPLKIAGADAAPVRAILWRA